jgi:hypothetical protein
MPPPAAAALFSTTRAQLAPGVFFMPHQLVVMAVAAAAAVFVLPRLPEMPLASADPVAASATAAGPARVSPWLLCLLLVCGW